MTDKQIAASWLLEKLRWIDTAVDHNHLREIAEVELTPERCLRIAQRIGEMCDKLRVPLMDYLNKSGCNTA